MEQMAVLIQAQLAKVGIKMRIPDALDLNGALIPKMMRGESNAYQIGLTGGPDLDDHVAKAFMKGSSFNVFPYENARVEDLIRQGRRTTDLQERARVYREATKVIMDDSPAILIVYSIDRYVGKKSVKGWFTGFKATTGYSEYWLAE
jgi:peptide/nickel transport system substrate-binding protein